ncbi:MAG: hypothetical protein WA231_20065 [Methylocella sp.]
MRNQKPSLAAAASVFEEAKRQGLEPVSVEDIHAAAGVKARHWRALFCRAGDR